jgi:ATP-dependent exoDNAse (exonuclease V) beta subunit
VTPVGSFDARVSDGVGSLAEPPVIPGKVRGAIIHEVLERLDGDLEELLEEMIGGLGEEDAGSHGGVRSARAHDRLRSEIETLLASDAWQEWVASEHHREMTFVHFAGPDDWRQGRIDLFIPSRSDASGVVTAPLIVDFKTDRVGDGGTDSLVDRYRVQGQVYREAVDAILGRTGSSGTGPDGITKVILHFTETGQQRPLE